MANIIPSQKGYRGKSPRSRRAGSSSSACAEAGIAYRVLEESEAAEGGPMVPVPLLEKIFSMKFELSLIDRIGIKRWPTDKLITNIASEATGHAIQPVIAEEGGARRQRARLPADAHHRDQVRLDGHLHRGAARGPEPVPGLVPVGSGAADGAAGERHPVRHAGGCRHAGCPPGGCRHADRGAAQHLLHRHAGSVA